MATGGKHKDHLIFRFQKNKKKSVNNQVLLSQTNFVAEEGGQLPIEEQGRKLEILLHDYAIPANMEQEELEN